MKRCIELLFPAIFALPLLASAATSNATETESGLASVPDFITEVTQRAMLWDDAEEVADRLSGVGEIVTLFSDDKCSAEITVSPPIAVEGVGAINISLKELCSGDEPAYPSSLVLNFNDGVASSDLAFALDEMLGPRHTSCSDSGRTIWAVSPDTSVALIDPFYPTFALMVVKAGVTDFDCSPLLGVPEADSKNAP